MEKYSVEQEGRPSDEKVSAGDKTCPVCGRTAEVHGRVLKCPDHGTEPWEALRGKGE